MAVSSPGRNVQLTLLTATCPPKRMVRSRVSRVEVIRASSQGVSCCRSPALPDHSDVMRGLDPRIHPLPECLLKWKTGWIAGSSPVNEGSKTSKGQDDFSSKISACCGSECSSP